MQPFDANDAMRVVDNFYDDPQAVRQLARASAYVPPGFLSRNVPGYESAAAFYSPAVVNKISRALDRELAVEPAHNAFGRFRLAFAKHRRPTKVHSDATHWTVVVYLTEDAHCAGGTEFFRHRATGLVGPPSTQWLHDNRVSLADFHAMVYEESLDASKWEKVGACSMRFNRAIFLRGDRYFHGGSHVFGDSFANGRLTQNFFFNVRGGA